MEQEEIKNELEKKLNELQFKGVIFDSINYTSNEQLNTFLNNSITSLTLSVLDVLYIIIDSFPKIVLLK